MPDFKHIIRNFSGGLLEDKREQSPNHFSITKHFDTFTYPAKLVPYGQTLTSNGLTIGGSPTALDIVRFLYAPISATLYRLFGLGVDGSGNTKLYVFDVDAGIPATSTWAALVNGASAFAGRDTNVFFYYKGFIYVYSQGTTIARADATSATSYNESWETITYVNGQGVQPIHHPSDDVAYFFGTNTVSTLNNTTWSSTVLQLPSDQQITCACAFGSYLAIGTVTTGNADIKSTVYLWDRDSSLTTLTDRIDFGAGSLVHLASLNNKLIGVMNFYMNNLYSLSKGKVLIKTVSGEFGVTVNAITTDTFTGQMPRSNCVKDNKLYFGMSAPLNGDARLGIWAVDQTGKITLDFVESAATEIDAIFPVGNSWWIAHSGNGSITYSDATGTYSSSNPSVWETLIVSTVNVTPRGTIIMNAVMEKKLIGVTVTTEPLPAGASVTLKYRVDSSLNNGAWTTIFTNSTVSSTNHSAVNIEATKGPFTNYHEIQFRTESTGGAVVTGLEYGGETIDSNLY